MSRSKKNSLDEAPQVLDSKQGANSQMGLPIRTEIQSAKVSFDIGKTARFKAQAKITNGGLLSIGVLVSSILLSTAVLVHVAVRGSKFRRR